MDIGFYKLDEYSEKIILLKIIKNAGRITRGQIVNMTGYSSAKISLMVSELEKDGLIEETGEDEPTGGRKAKLLRLRGDRAYFIGVELGGYELKIVLTDFCGTRISCSKLLENSDALEPGKVINQLKGFIRNFIDSNALYKDKLKGIGLAVSGIVDDKTGGCSYFRNQKQWEGIPLKKMIEEEFHLPCYTEDSSRAMAISERIYGCCKDVDNFILLSIGLGLGTGIFVDGKLFRGSKGVGGEIGHMVINKNGPRCVCGNYGCLESLVSGYAIERQLKEALSDNVYSSLSLSGMATAKDVIEHARNGDKLAYSIINNAAKQLGVGISNVINIFNPEMVVLAGGISKAGSLLLEPIEQEVRAAALEISAKSCSIVISGLDEFSAALGVANICIDKIIEDKNLTFLHP